MIQKVKFQIVLLSLVIPLFVGGISFAQHDSRGDRGSDPLMIFEEMVDEANSDGYALQETAIDGVSDQEGSYAQKYKISNTLDYIRKNLDPYLQWTIYIGLVLATIALIYAGFMLVTNSIHKQGDWTKVKTNIVHALIGVFLLSGFYFIIKLIVALITSIFGGANGNTGF